MKRILYITNLNKHWDYISRLGEYLQEAGDDLFEQVSFETRSFKNNPSFDEDWKKAVKEADAIILTHMGTGFDSPFLQQLASWLYKYHPCYVLYVEEEDKEKLSKCFTDEAILTIEKYIRYSGEANYRHLLAYVSSFLGEAIPYEEPTHLPWQGIINREGDYFATYDEYMKAHGDYSKPSVGIFFYREEWVSRELFYQQALFDELEALGMNAILFFGQYAGNPRIGSPNLKTSLNALFGEGKLPLSLFIDTGKFSLFSLGALTQEDLNYYNIPIIQAYNIYMTEAAWKESIQGLTPMDVSLSIALPEMDGAIHGGVLAAQTETEDGSFIYLPVQERIQALAKRVYKWIKLRQLENKDKKVAIIFHNYPPSNSNIGSACGLDSPESVRLLLEAMKAEGYTIDHVPETSAAFMEEVLSHATNDRRFMSEEQVDRAEGKLTASEYYEFFNTLSDKVKHHMEEGWGEAPGEVFRYGEELLVPGFKNGNIWITVQPPRGFGEDASKIYHDPLCSPTHHYEGFYYWLREIFKADAVCHIGTHGNLEWLPGKGTGMGPDCYPEIAIQDLPNIYPYWTTIVGEGIQAKRRGYACLIGHLTPPMAHSGLYDTYEELEALLDEYEHFRQQDEGQASTTAELLVEKAKECHLWEEIPRVEELSIEDIAGELHRLLTDLKHIQMRCGLHILGKAPRGEHLREFLSGLVRVENGGLPALPHLLSQAKGYDFLELQEHSGEYTEEGGLKGKLVDFIWETVEELILYAESKEYQLPDKDILISQLKALPKLSSFIKEEEQWKELAHIAETMCTTYVGDLNKTVQEISNTLRALSGEYVEGGPGGAPTGGRADVLPTGRNFYGVDERMLPTKAAYAIGTQLADQVIESFIAEEKRYPEQVGIVLWAGSNTRSHGQCVAQFMNLMGIRPVWLPGSGRVVGVEIIPLEELKRPRIDVTGRISGLIRDMMPNVIKWLDKAALLVASLDESPEDNYLKKHVEEDVQWLVEEGETLEDAYIKARWRIFGDPLGGYGAGVGKVLEAKNWETIDDLAEVYVKWGSYSYSTEKPLAHDDRLFRKRLATMEVTIKNEDNREVSMLSSDDYNAYHGGLIAAVRSLSGKKPKSYVGDSSDKEHIQTRDLQTEIKRLFRAEAVNPKFIEGMMNHGYKGAADMANYVAHSYQWDATSDVMDDWMYEEYARKYAFDPTVQEWMKDVNPWALQRIAETLLEANQRGLWNAPESMQEELKELYLSLEGSLEERSEC